MHIKNKLGLTYKFLGYYATMQRNGARVPISDRSIFLVHALFSKLQKGTRYTRSVRSIIIRREQRWTLLVSFTRTKRLSQLLASSKA